MAIDGSKFKAVNNRDRELQRANGKRRRAQLEESVALPLTASVQQPKKIYRIGMLERTSPAKCCQPRWLSTSIAGIWLH